MNNLVWGKTILSLSSKLPLAIKNLDNSIDAYIASTFKRKSDAYSEIDGLRLIILKKKNLQLVSIIYDEIMSKMEVVNCKILKYRYFFNDGFKDIANKLELSIRTIFRKYDSALDTFCKIMLELGYDANKLENYFGDEPYVMQEYKFQEKLLNRQTASAHTKIVYTLPLSIKTERGDECAKKVCSKQNHLYN